MEKQSKTLMKAYELKIFADSLAQMRDKKCLKIYVESFTLSMSIDDYISAGITSLCIGRVYVMIQNIQDLKKAKYWYKHSLKLLKFDDLWHARTLSHLGDLQLYFLQGDIANSNMERYVDEGVTYLEEALKLFPKSELADIANTYSTIATIYSETGQIEKARFYISQAVDYHEKVGNYYFIANTYYNFAKALANKGQLWEAHIYMQTSVKIYKDFCPNFSHALEIAQKSLKLIEESLK